MRQRETERERKRETERERDKQTGRLFIMPTGTRAGPAFATPRETN